MVFASEEALTGALEIKRKVMGHRFVTVERADAAEYKSAFPPAPAPGSPGKHASSPGGQGKQALSPGKQSTSGAAAPPAAAGAGSPPHVTPTSAPTPAAATQNGRTAGVGSVRGSAGGAANGSNGAASGGGGGAREESGSIVIKMRGLPYSATEAEIANFFAGLKIANGGVSIGRDASGRASGEAHVEFVSDQDAQSAMLLNRQRIGARYIELFRTKQAPSAARRAIASATSEVGGSSSDCLRLRGMPFNSTEADVQTFFKG